MILLAAGLILTISFKLIVGAIVEYMGGDDEYGDLAMEIAGKILVPILISFILGIILLVIGLAYDEILLSMYRKLARKIKFLRLKGKPLGKKEQVLGRLENQLKLLNRWTSSFEEKMNALDITRELRKRVIKTWVLSIACFGLAIGTWFFADYVLYLSLIHI